MDHNNLDPLIGKFVRATCLKNTTGYTDEAVAKRKRCDTQIGRVMGFNRHGLCYEVRFSKGQTAWFEPEELSVLPAEAQIRAAKFLETFNRLCAHCGIRLFGSENSEVICDYMATDEAWEKVGFKKKEIACLACFETRLDRDLREEDLSSAVINRLLRHCLRANFKPWKTQKSSEPRKTEDK
jgi:hypothetical protein